MKLCGALANAMIINSMSQPGLLYGSVWVGWVGIQAQPCGYGVGPSSWLSGSESCFSNVLIPIRSGVAQHELIDLVTDSG